MIFFARKFLLVKIRSYFPRNKAVSQIQVVVIVSQISIDSFRYFLGLKNLPAFR